MAAPTDTRQTTAEALIAWTIGATWVLWLVGALYMAGPVLGWTLAWLSARAYYIAPALPETERPGRLPSALWAWLIGMSAMLVILFIGHSNFSLGTGQTIKSAVGWAKGWALLALYPLAGYVLPIRLEVVSRAVCRLSRQTLFLLPIFIAAPFLHLPGTLWVSPLRIFGGSGDEFFAAILYTQEPDAGMPRWQFFAPWSPAVGMVAVIHFLLAREEKAPGWRWTGYAASVLMALLSLSRLALVALLVIIPLGMIATRLRRPGTWAVAAVLTMLAGWFAAPIHALMDKAASDFAGARADSSRVRAALGRIAVQRWQHEAYWFGHGMVERGPHMVEYMPIGSHHSWYGLLYVKGLTGAISLAVPMFWTLASCLVAAIRNRQGQVAFSMILAYWLYSFGENLEVLTYISWPALLTIGVVFRQMREAADAARGGSSPPADPPTDAAG